MNFSEFQTLVEQNAEWFRGEQPETSASLASAEQSLGCTLPPSMKWLLSEWGYSEACGVDGISGTVEDTSRCRQTMQLQGRYVILNDWHDAGVVFFDTTTSDSEGEYKIYWTGTHNIYRLARGEEMVGKVDVFENYPAWVLNRLEAAKANFEDYEDEED